MSVCRSALWRFRFFVCWRQKLDCAKPRAIALQNINWPNSMVFLVSPKAKVIGNIKGCYNGDRLPATDIKTNQIFNSNFILQFTHQILYSMDVLFIQPFNESLFCWLCKGLYSHHTVANTEYTWIILFFLLKFSAPQSLSCTQTYKSLVVGNGSSSSLLLLCYNQFSANEKKKYCKKDENTY